MSTIENCAEGDAIQFMVLTDRKLYIFPIQIWGSYTDLPYESRPPGTWGAVKSLLSEKWVSGIMSNIMTPLHPEAAYQNIVSTVTWSYQE